jgi:hypothetical protein
LKTLDSYVGAYGPDWITGVVTDHVGSALEAGALLHKAASGKTYLTGPKGGVAIPVLCGELVPVATEDGVIDGRCGLPVLNDDLACPGHHEVIMSYRSNYDHLYEWETADA